MKQLLKSILFNMLIVLLIIGTTNMTNVGTVIALLIAAIVLPFVPRPSHTNNIVAMGRSNSYDARLCYKNAQTTIQGWLEDAKKKGKELNMDDAVLSPGYLRTEVPLNGTDTKYTFGILDTQASTPNLGNNAAFPQEQRLTLQDTFFVNEIQFGIRILSTTGGNTEFADIIGTFPTAWDFPSATYDIYTFMKLWAGQLEIKVNNRIIIPAWNLDRHLQIEQTQYPIWTVPPTQVSPYDQYDGSSTGFYPCEPNIAFIGTKGNVVTMSLPNSLGVLNFPGSMKINAVLKFHGVLAQNTSGLYFN